MGEWHLSIGGQQRGPYDEATIREWQTTGRLPAETLVWAAHLPGWEPSAAIFGPPPEAPPLQPPPPPQPPPTQDGPPGAWASSLPYSASGLHLLGRWAQGLLIATGAMSAIAALVGVNAWNVFRDLVAGTATSFDSASADDTYWITVGLAFLLALPTAVVIIVWMFRYWGQLRAVRGETATRHGRGWTIAGWLVPIANLFRPKQIIDDYWRATDSAPRGLPATVSPMVHVWWAAWLVGSALQRIAGRLEPVDEGSWHTFYRVTIASDVLWAAAAFLAAAVVRELVTRLSGLTGVQR